MVQESYVKRYPDCPLEGPDTVVHLLMHMLRFGGSPRGWLDVVSNHIDRKDLTCHEVETLTEVTLLCGAYDQPNSPPLMSFEKVSRRPQLIVEAHAEVAQAPSWKMAR